MREFEIIARYFEPVGERWRCPNVSLGIGDDCALLRVPEGQELAVSVDTMVEGVHFPQHYPADRLAWRALATAVSDLAAMGAEPLGYTLALTLPESDTGWLETFAAALAQSSQTLEIMLVGGDTTRGPLTLSVQVQGLVPVGGALKRSGARPGDRICVSGTLGDAGEALRWLDKPSHDPAVARVLERYHHPLPRIALGQWLRGKATAAIDVSDGLAADLEHILQASGVGGCLELQRLPLSPAIRSLRGSQAAEQALRAGDDYELCFTWPEERALPAAVDGVPVTDIGRVEAAAGLRVRRGSDVETIIAGGYDHFGADPEPEP